MVYEPSISKFYRSALSVHAWPGLVPKIDELLIQWFLTSHSLYIPLYFSLEVPCAILITPSAGFLKLSVLHELILIPKSQTFYGCDLVYL